MEILTNAWSSSLPYIFLSLLIVAIIFTVAFMQKQLYKLLLKIAVEIRGLFSNSELHAINEGNRATKVITLLSLLLSSLFSIFIVCFMVGTIMIYAVSETLAVFELSLFSSFVKVVLEWILLIISAILLIFAGIYASKFTSHYINKANLSHARLYAQFTSLLLIILTLGLSLNYMNSAISIANLSLIMISASAGISLLLPAFKYIHSKNRNTRKSYKLNFHRR